MLRVDLSPLDEGHHELTLEPSAEDLGLDPEVFSQVAVELRLDVAERRVVASFDVSGLATLECDRTLVMYQEPLHGDHAIVFLPPEHIVEDSEDDSLQALPDTDTEIDLTSAIRDTLMLSVPLRRVAPEAEEAEISTSYGDQQEFEDAPIDHRWDALRKLRSENSD